MGEFSRVEKHLFSRLLYPNPVCLLGTVSKEGSVNAMTVSWLSCINNHGVFFLSINEKRFSAVALQQKLCFSLCIAHAGMKSLLLDVGGSSGRDGCKCDRFPQLKKTSINASREYAGGDWVYFDGSIANLECIIVSITRDHGHLLITARINQAFASSCHWNGRNLCDTLSFLGSQTFSN